MPAVKNNQYALGNKGGRPTRYRDEYADQAYRLCMLGQTDAGLAVFFGVDESTINRWKVRHEEFCQSLTRGKTLADAEVAVSLHRRATGYTYTAEKLFIHKGNVIRIPVRMVVIPDAKAAIFWLRSRQASKWGDGQNTNLTGTVDVTLNLGYDPDQPH